MARGHTAQNGHDQMPTQMYLRFGAMILTGMVVMYWVMFLGSWELSHVRWSQSRMFMALTMGGTMGLVMLAWMLNMYRNTTANVIAQNGPAFNREEADARQVPDFHRSATRQCR